jgi:hypothetical protein
LIDVLTAPSFFENYLADFRIKFAYYVTLVSLFFISLSNAVSISISVNANELASATAASAGLFSISFLNFSIYFFCAV